MSILVVLCLTASGFAGSDRAALNLAIAGTRGAPPDLSRLIVERRKEFLTGVRDAAHRPAPADAAGEARGISRAILSRTPIADVVRRIGAAVGGLLAAECPAPIDRIEAASAGPYRIPGVSAAAAAGDPAGVARSIAAARGDFSSAHAVAEDVAARIVTDETNLLWAIWTGAGGDARPAKNWNERNGPYVIAGAPR